MNTAKKPSALLGIFVPAILCGCSAPTESPEPSTTVVVTSRSGSDIVNQYCVSCHGRGLYNAPMMADTSAWQARLQRGSESLWQSVLQGRLAMPARGSCADCSDDELRAAMDHMLAQVTAPASSG